MRDERKEKLTDKQIEGYRQWLAELEEETLETGDADCFDKDIWEIFTPASPVGRQIYMSYSNEELLDCLLKTMEPPGYQLHFEKLYYIYKQYIRVRFGNLERAAKVAQIHRKQLQDQERWPSDWPERVSMELFIEEMRHRGKELLLEDYRMLEGLCRTAKESGYPPVLSDPQRKRLDSLYNWKKAYEMMGIPALNKPARAHMIRYWDHERKKTEEK